MQRIIALTLVIVSVAGSAIAQSTSAPAMDVRYLHVMLGALELDDAWTISDEDGVETAADPEDLIYGGVTAQLTSGTGVFQYGIETGGMISYKNDTSYFIRQDGGLSGQITIKNQLWMLDMSLGGFVSIRPLSSLRLYASAGPAILFGSIAIDDEVEIEPYDGGGSSVTINPSSREFDADIGFYGRVGMDLILGNGFIAGLSARRVDGEMDFGNSGTIKLDDTQYFITFGKAY